MDIYNYRVLYAKQHYKSINVVIIIELQIQINNKNITWKKLFTIVSFFQMLYWIYSPLSYAEIFAHRPTCIHT